MTSRQRRSHETKAVPQGCSTSCQDPPKGLRWCSAWAPGALHLPFRPTKVCGSAAAGSVSTSLTTHVWPSIGSPRRLAKTSSWPQTQEPQSPSPQKRSLSGQASSLGALSTSRGRSASPTPHITVQSRSPSPVKSARSLFGQTSISASLQPAPSTSASVSTSLKRTYGRSASPARPEASSGPSSSTIKADDQEALLLKPLSPPPSAASFSSTSAPNDRQHQIKSLLKTRESYKDMRKRFGVDESDSENDDGDGDDAQRVSRAAQSPQLKRKGSSKTAAPAAAAGTSSPTPEELGLVGVTALRAQGQKKQFEDDLAYLLEGLIGEGEESPGLGLQRGSALELCRRLQLEPLSDFARAVKIFGAMPRLVFALLDALPPSGDLVSSNLSRRFSCSNLIFCVGPGPGRLSCISLRLNLARSAGG